MYIDSCLRKKLIMPDIDQVIKRFSNHPDFCKMYTNWLCTHHHFMYLACLLAIEGKEIDFC